jgi:hypothetical protein
MLMTTVMGGLNPTTAAADVAGYYESNGTTRVSYVAPDGSVLAVPTTLSGNLLDQMTATLDKNQVCDSLRQQVENRGGHTAGWPCVVGDPHLFLSSQPDGIHIQVELQVTHLEFTWTVPVIPDPDVVSQFNVYVDATIAADDHVDGSQRPSPTSPLRVTKVDTTIGQTHLSTDDVLVPGSYLRDAEAQFNSTHSTQTPGPQPSGGMLLNLEKAIAAADNSMRDGAKGFAATLASSYPSTNTYFELQTSIAPGTGNVDAEFVVTYTRAFNPPNVSQCVPAVVWPGTSIQARCRDTNDIVELRGILPGQAEAQLDSDQNVGRSIPVNLNWTNNTNDTVSGDFFVCGSNRYGQICGPHLTLQPTGAGPAPLPSSGGMSDDPGSSRCFSGYRPTPCRHLYT